jgi:hypothetical protein
LKPTAYGPGSKLAQSGELSAAREGSAATNNPTSVTNKRKIVMGFIGALVGAAWSAISFVRVSALVQVYAPATLIEGLRLTPNKLGDI